MEFYYHEIDDDVLILSADGGLNADMATSFVHQIEALVDGGVKKMIVDCAALDYISSYGLGVLIHLHKKLAARGGDVKLADVKSVMVRILSVAHLDEYFSIYPDVNRARLAFRPAAP